MSLALQILTVAGYGVVVGSLAYAMVALLRLAALPPRADGRAGGLPAGRLPPITILKPVCGLEPRLYENLRSFCEQDYPQFQILFGVRDANDPAIPMIERLVREFPARDAALIVDPRVVGSNYKISNLANMMARARHDIVAISDADCRVGPGYLTDVAVAFDDPAVGAATCLYGGSPASKRIADRLGAMFINEWFLPSVLVALLSEPLEYCFGATMAARREVLDKIGGIEALAFYLADDHMLGRLAAANGYKVALARHIVEITVDESSLKALFLHEMRWARTMRAVRPVGYAMSFLTDALVLSVLVGCAAGLQPIGIGFIGLALLLRVLTHAVAGAKLRVEGSFRPWLVPLRDAMTFAIRVASFVGRGVKWREQEFSVRPDGHLVVNN